jgi:dTDP-L-rhamnose 4-epimerase
MQDAILITGGAGFIGCAISQKLLANGQKVVAIDNLHPQVHPEQRRPAALPSAVELIQADVAQESTWDQVLKRFSPTAVIHLAAETGTGQSLLEASRHGYANVMGTTRMTDAFAKHGVKPVRMLLTSSRAVYGEGAWLAQDHIKHYPGPRKAAELSNHIWLPQVANAQLSEAVAHNAATVHAMPTSIYGATKLTQEQILDSWCDAMQVPLTVLRLQNVYGPGQSPFNAYTGIVTFFHRQAHALKQIEVYEDGRIGRDFVFIDDVADSILAGLKADHIGRRTLDVGTGVATTVHEAANEIASMYGAPKPVVCGKFRPGDVRWAVADAQALKDVLGVRCEISFAQGSRAVSQWLGENGYF